MTSTQDLHMVSVKAVMKATEWDSIENRLTSLHSCYNVWMKMGGKIINSRHLTCLFEDGILYVIVTQR